MFPFMSQTGRGSYITMSGHAHGYISSLDFAAFCSVVRESLSRYSGIACFLTRLCFGKNTSYIGFGW